MDVYTVSWQWHDGEPQFQYMHLSCAIIILANRSGPSSLLHGLALLLDSGIRKILYLHCLQIVISLYNYSLELKLEHRAVYDLINLNVLFRAFDHSDHWSCIKCEIVYSELSPSSVLSYSIVASVRSNFVLRNISVN